jgi:hypothetical protein
MLRPIPAAEYFRTANFRRRHFPDGVRNQQAPSPIPRGLFLAGQKGLFPGRTLPNPTEELPLLVNF